jgi:hypothetical protein
MHIDIKISIHMHKETYKYIHKDKFYINTDPFNVYIRYLKCTLFLNHTYQHALFAVKTSLLQEVCLTVSLRMSGSQLLCHMLLKYMYVYIYIYIHINMYIYIY